MQIELNRNFNTSIGRVWRLSTQSVEILWLRLGHRAGESLRADLPGSPEIESSLPSPRVNRIFRKCVEINTEGLQESRIFQRSPEMVGGVWGWESWWKKISRLELVYLPNIWCLIGPGFGGFDQIYSLFTREKNPWFTFSGWEFFLRFYPSRSSSVGTCCNQLKSLEV